MYRGISPCIEEWAQRPLASFFKAGPARQMQQGRWPVAVRTRVQEASQRHYVRAYRRPHSGTTYARTGGLTAAVRTRVRTDARDETQLPNMRAPEHPSCTLTSCHHPRASATRQRQRGPCESVQRIQDWTPRRAGPPPVSRNRRRRLRDLTLRPRDEHALRAQYGPPSEFRMALDERPHASTGLRATC